MCNANEMLIYMQMQQAPIQSGERWNNLQPMRELVAVSGETGVFGSFTLSQPIEEATPCIASIKYFFHLNSVDFCFHNWSLSHLVFVSPGFCFSLILLAHLDFVSTGFYLPWTLSVSNPQTLSLLGFVSLGLWITLDWVSPGIWSEVP